MLHLRLGSPPLSAYFSSDILSCFRQVGGHVSPQLARPAFRPPPPTRVRTACLLSPQPKTTVERPVHAQVPATTRVRAAAPSDRWVHGYFFFASEQRRGRARDLGAAKETTARTLYVVSPSRSASQSVSQPLSPVFCLLFSLPSSLSCSVSPPRSCPFSSLLSLALSCLLYVCLCLAAACSSF